jgi:hypothetical protein
MTIVCLRRYEDWTFREAKVHLCEHRELRAALWLSSVPDYAIQYRFFLRRLPDAIENVLGESVQRFRQGPCLGRISSAVDGMG